MNILSYSMFTPRSSDRGHRTWDNHYVLDRYWFNIPSIVAIYGTLYSDFIITIHISSDIIDHPMYGLLESLVKHKLIELVIHNESYIGLEPTIWRYSTLFDDIETLFVRDLDSIPNLFEILSNNHFIESEFIVSSIRSHSGHNCKNTRMLAGLSSFKPNMINHNDVTYNKLFNSYNNRSWGVDQTIINHYILDKLKLSDRFVDYQSQSDGHVIQLPKHNCNWVNIKELDNTYGNDHIELFKVLNNLTQWSGQPIDVRNESLRLILKNSSNGDVINSIITDTKLNEVFGVNL